MNSQTEMFKTIDPDHRGASSEEVVTRLREMIQRGELKHGDRLPPERDLAKMLGVSRPTLRAGIRSLSAVGVLQSKQGAGTFVVEAKESPTLDGSSLQMLAALNNFSSDEMFEARLALEMSIAALAAERASNEQLMQMSEEIAGMYAALEEPEQYLIHDMNFHQTIAAASGNRILTALMNMVAQILLENRKEIVRQGLDLKKWAEQHREIYRAIREHKTEDARQAMHSHLTAARKMQRLEARKTGASSQTNKEL